LSLRYNVEDGRDLNQLVGSTLDGGGIGAPSSGHNLFLRDQSLVGTVSTIIKPNLVNSVLAQYARRHYNFPGVTGQPNLDIPNTLLFGHNFGVFDAIYESRFQLADNISWVKGNHVAKFGVDYNYVNNFVIWPGFTPMRIVLPRSQLPGGFCQLRGYDRGYSVESCRRTVSDFDRFPCRSGAQSARSIERRSDRLLGSSGRKRAQSSERSASNSTANSDKLEECVSPVRNGELFRNSRSRLLWILRSGSVAGQAQFDG